MKKRFAIVVPVSDILTLIFSVIVTVYTYRNLSMRKSLSL